jgi:hypothetical protein
MSRVTLPFPWLLWLALLAFSVAAYPTLPNQIPQQLDAAGRIAGTTARSPASWGMLPGLAAALLLLLQGIAHQLPRRPHWFNYPAKAQLLALPASWRAPIIAGMQRFLDLVAVELVLVMGAVQGMLWHTAHGGDGALALPLILGVSVVSTPLLLLGVSRLSDATEQAHRQWTERGRPTA